MTYARHTSIQNFFVSARVSNGRVFVQRVCACLAGAPPPIRHTHGRRQWSLREASFRRLYRRPNGHKIGRIERVS